MGNYHSRFVLACKQGDLESVKKYVESGGYIDESDNEAVKTGVKYNRINILEYFIQQGVRPKLILEYAIADDNLNCVKFLIENGHYEIHAKNEYALTLACAYGRIEIVRYLVSRDADIHNSDDQPLQTAIYNGHIQIIDYLIRHGANIEKVYPHLDKILQKRDQPQVREYLKSLRMSDEPTEIDALRCSICYVNQRNVLFNCDHFATCTGCSERIDTCPICRVPITSKRRVLLS